MKTKIILLFAIPVGVAALIFGYVQMSQDTAADAKADHPFAAASRIEHGPGGEVSVALDANAQQLIGLRTVTLPGVILPPETEGYGHVLNSVRLVAMENAINSAQASLELSEREYQRLKKLTAQNNASLQALQTATAKLKQDQNALATAKAQLAAASCRALLNQSSDFFQSLANEQTVLVRLDLPAGDWINTTPTAAKLKLTNNRRPITAAFLGQAATTDPQMQGEGFLFTVTNAPEMLRPNFAVTGYLQLPGKPSKGVILPDDAVVRSDNRAWIYVQTSPTNFARREILLSQRRNGGWFTTNHVSPGDKVVVTGAQMLLSEERKSQIKIED